MVVCGPEVITGFIPCCFSGKKRVIICFLDCVLLEEPVLPLCLRKKSLSMAIRPLQATNPASTFQAEPVEILYHSDITARARGYKTLFMLNSAEHEILNAHKCKISRNAAF